MNFGLFLIFRLFYVFGCRESVCRRRRNSDKVQTFAWGNCTPWQIQIAFCLGINLKIFKSKFLTNESFYDFISTCDSECRGANLKKSENCKKCWKISINQYKKELIIFYYQIQEKIIDIGILHQCIGTFSLV